MKKAILSVSLSAILATQGNTAVLPVIDNSNIAQQVMQYSQMIKDYTQMLKDTMNFEKQMKELGVDLTNIQEIYGNTLDIIDTATSLYQDIINIPEDVYGELAKIKNTCNLLTQIPNTKNISEALNKARKVERKFNGCLSALSNTTAIIEDIEDKQDEIEELRKKAFENGDSSGEITNKIAQLNMDIKVMNQAKDYANTLKQNEANTQMLSRLDNIAEFDSKSHSKKIEAFTKEMNKPLNAKQGQALTNSLLLEVVQQQQKVFELQAQYYQMELAEKNAKLEQVKEPKQEKANIKSLQETNSYFAEAVEKGKKVKFNSAGVPTFIPALSYD